MKSKYVYTLIDLLVLCIFLSILFLSNCVGTSGGGQSSGGSPMFLLLLVIMLISILLGRRTTGQSSAKKVFAIISLILWVIFMGVAISLLNSKLFSILNDQTYISVQTIVTELLPLQFLLIIPIFFLIVGMRFYQWKHSKYVQGFVTLCIGFLMLQSLYNSIQMASFTQRAMDSVQYSDTMVEQYPAVIEKDEPEQVITQAPLHEKTVTDEAPEETMESDTIPEVTEVRPKDVPIARSYSLNESYGFAFWVILFFSLGISLIVQHARQEKFPSIESSLTGAQSYLKNPLFCVWTHPRQAYRLMNDRYSKLYLFMIITTFSAFVIAGFTAASSAAGEKTVFQNILFRHVTLSILSGMLILPLSGIGLMYIARLLGGKGTWRNNVTSLATSHIPMASLLLFWILILSIFGNHIFQPEFNAVNYPIFIILFLILFLLLYNIVALWCLILSFHIVSEANTFSKWRAFLSLLILNFCIFILYIPIKIVF